MIPSLIDKQDNFEIIRDQIALILANESANQQALATGAGKDPDDWKLRIFTEQTNPLEQWLNVQASTDKSPLVIVWFDNSTFDPRASNAVERQKSDTVYNIDCYGYGESSDNPAGGHNPGDKISAFETQRAVRLVRNILMAAEYIDLEFTGLVWSRWPQSITSFQPQLLGQQIQHVQGARIAFRVGFNEFSPQVAFEALEIVSVDIKRAEDGQIVAEADYDYTAP